MNPQLPSLFRVVVSFAIGAVLSGNSLKAECQCGRGRTASVMNYGPAVSHNYVGSGIYDGTSMYSGIIGGTSIMDGSSGAYSAPMAYGSPVVADSAPPPGTLGQTYQRPMRPIPVDRHPRIGIVDVRVNGASSVKVYGTNEFRTKDGITGIQDRRDASVWRFESEPLIPGVPHIYRVVAKYGDSAQERYIRLVPGRIVTLDF